MASTLSPTQSELSAALWSTHPSVDAMIKRSLLGKRASRSLTRFLIIFGIGVAATLACFGGIVAVALTTSVYTFGQTGSAPVDPGVRGGPAGAGAPTKLRSSRMGRRGSLMSRS